MRITRDIVIIAAFLTLMVSSTAAWAINNQGEYTANFVQIMDSPMNILDKTSQITAGNMIVELDIVNEATTKKTVTVMIQVTDVNGDPLYVIPTGTDPAREIIGESDAQLVTFNKGQQKSFYFSINLLGRASEADGYTVYIVESEADYNIRTEKTEGGLQRDISESAIVYRTDDTKKPWNQYPQYRQYTGGVWTTQSAMPELVASQTIYTDTVRIAASSDTTKTQYVAAIMKTDGKLNIYLWASTYWIKAVFDTAIGVGTQQIKPFDVEYETGSHDAIVVYAGSAGQINGKQLIGTTWYTMPTLSVGASLTKYIKLAPNPDPTSDRIALVAITENRKAYAAIWNGNSWQDIEEITDATNLATSYSYECADIAYKQSSKKPMVAVASGYKIILQNYDSSRTAGNRWIPDPQWYDLTPRPPPLPPIKGPDGIKTHTNTDGAIRWVVFNAKRQTSSDNLALMTLDYSTNVAHPNGVYLSGYLQNNPGDAYFWENKQELARTMETSDYRTIDGEWAPDGTQFWVVGASLDATGIKYKVFDVDYATFDEMGTTVDTWYTYALGGGQIKWVQVRATPFLGEPNFFVTTIDDAAVIKTTNIDTTSTPTDQSGFSMQQITSTTATSFTKECFDIAVKIE